MEILKRQFSYLFMASLEMYSHVNKTNSEIELNNLSSNALKILLTKPNFWEYELFAQVLRNEIYSYDKECYDLLYGVTYGKHVKIPSFTDLGEWINAQLGHVEDIIDTLRKLMNEGLTVVFGHCGVPTYNIFG